MQNQNIKNILLAISSLAILLLVVYIYMINPKPNRSDLSAAETGSGQLAIKADDIYRLGYAEDDMNGTKSIITKRIMDFYCKNMQYYSVSTGEEQIGAFYCAKINGPTVISSSDTVNCKLVLNTNTPNGLNENLDTCIEMGSKIKDAIMKKFELSNDDKLELNYLESNMLNDTFKIGVGVNCNNKNQDENIGCAGIEYAVFDKGNVILVGFNDNCKADKSVCDKIVELEK